MSKTNTKEGLLERLRQGPVICAEGYIFELERRGYVQAGAYVPEVVLEHPEVVVQLHKEFIRAGTDVVPALTYYGHREKLRLIGRENDLEQLNRTAIRLAHEAVGDADVLIAGNICNTWAYKPEDPKSTAEVRRQYTEQLTWAVEEGIDFVLAETLEYVGEALIALEVIKSFNLPAVINFTPIYKQSKDNYDWVEACRLLEKAGADVVGFNCGRGPNTLLPLLRELKSKVGTPIAAVPVPYRTTATEPAFQFLKRGDGSSAYTTGLDRHLIDRHDAAAFALDAVEVGANFVGLCCGAGPQHIRAIAEALGRKPEAGRYSADFSRHGLLGDDTVVKQHEKQFIELWNK